MKKILTKIPELVKKISIPGLTYILVLILSVALKLIHFQYTTGLNSGIWNSYFNIKMLLCSLGIVLILMGFVYLIAGKRWYGAFLILDLVLTVILFSDTLYYRYYSNAITIPVLFQLGQVGSVTESAFSLLKFRDIIFILDFPFFIAILLLFRGFKSGKSAGKAYTWGRLALSILLAAAGLLMTNYTLSRTSTGIFTYDNNPVVSSLGAIYFHYYDIERYAKENLFTDRSLSNDEKVSIQAFYETKPEVSKNFNGAAKGMNVIMVQVEALQQFPIGKTIEGKKLTPNMDKLIGESRYFDNIYFQIGGGNTSDAEFLTNTSLYPLRDGSVYFRFPSNTYESLPKTLKASGYNTYVFHANNPSFWNRTEMYRALGFDTFFSKSDFVNDEDIGWGLTDKSFFRQALDKMDPSKPFYSFLITLSSHYPYNFFETTHDIYTGSYEYSFLGNYLKAVHYVDAAIGSLVDDLKKRGLYDKTVLVIYGDHYAVQKNNIPQLESFLKYKDSPVEWQKLQKVPLIIHCPGLSPETSHKIGGEVDIFPTIANLLGAEAPYALGKDLFNTSESYAVLRSGCLVTKDFIYLNDTDKVYDVSGNELDRAKYEKRIKELKNQLSVSDSIINKDAFKKLAGK